MSSAARRNNACRAQLLSTKVWAQGTFKHVYEGRYTEGIHKGQPCVLKLFKNSRLDDSFYEHELAVVEKAMEFIDAFNAGEFLTKTIYLNEPQIWQFSEESDAGWAGRKHLVEPKIKQFEKMNTNTGWSRATTAWAQALQALSHFSFHASEQQLLLCDLQGGAWKGGFVLTDPVVMSWDGEFGGPADLGARGIEQFFTLHRCSQFCHSAWSKPATQKLHFPVSEGTTMNDGGSGWSSEWKSRPPSY